MAGCFNEDICAAARRHAEAEAPYEACALVVNGRYEPCENTADDPARDFKIDMRVLLRAQHRGLQAVIHSHIGSPRPSPYDLIQQQLLSVPWAIVAVDGDGRAGEILIFEAIP